MKSLKLIGLAIVTIVMSVNFAACSDDDDDVDVSELLGVWEAIHIEGYETYQGETERWNTDIDAATYDDGEYPRVEFLNNGVVKTYYYSNGWTDDEEGKYQVNGNKIHIQGYGDDEGYYLTIVSLNSNQLIVEEKDSEDGEEYYEKVTYKRIK